MKTIIRIFQVIFAIAAIGIGIYFEEYVSRGFGMFWGMTLVGIGLIFENRYDQLEHFFSIVGCLLSFVFFFGIALEIHIEEVPDGIAIKSPYYTHTLETGERIDTMQLQSYYNQYYSRYEVKTETFYFLYDGLHCSVYNHYGKVLELDTSFSIGEKDYGHGKINYIRVGNQAFDMRGTKIDEDFSPYVSDRTPDYNNYANL